MRIGVYFREVAPESGGGYTFEADLLETILGRRSDTGHSFVFLGPPSHVLERLGALGCETVSVPVEGVRRWILKAPARPRYSRPFHLGSRLDQRIERAGIDVLWCLGPDVPSMELPYVMTVWDLQHRLQPFFPEVSSRGVWAARERYYAPRLRRATFVVSGTDAGRREIENFYQVPADRVIKCPHPTPRFALEQGGPADTSTLNRLGVDAPYIFYPAQFWPHKNHVVLLKALKALHDQGIHLRLVFAGSDRGKNLSHIRSVATHLGVAESVLFPGFVDRDQLVALYRGALVMAYVSYFGPENLPPLEAFALGCPVIAARVAGAEEQLGAAAQLVDPRDHQEIAAEIDRVFRDPSHRSSLIARGLERARESTCDHLVDRVLGTLERFSPVRETWNRRLS